MGKRKIWKRAGAMVMAMSIAITGLPAWQVSAQEQEAGTGKTYEPTWESLEQVETAPEWFQDAKFGIYFHWGAFTTPEYGYEWYGQKMGTEWKDHHESTYGTIADWPYHNFIIGAEDLQGNWVQFKPVLKSEGGVFDPEEWAELFAAAGAKFAGPVMEHHDGFSMWDSDVTPWNSVDLGPHLDLARLFVDAIRGQGMKVVASMHHAYNVEGDFYGSYVDETQPWKKEVPGMTEEDIKKLYGRFDSEEEEDAFWLAKLKEIIDLYDPDIIWQDFGLDGISEEARLEFLSYFYNKDAEEGGDGVVATYKYNNEYNDGFTEETGMPDYERGGPGSRKDFYWLTDDTVAGPPTSPFSYVEGITYTTAKAQIHSLLDKISKNGNLLLNVAPRADGSIPQEQKDMLYEIGDWLEKYGEAVYSTRAWSVYGEGPTLMGGGSFQAPREGGEKDIRFTRSKDQKILYALSMGLPEDGVMDITTLKEGVFDASGLTGIFLADGSENSQALSYVQDEQGLHITLPEMTDEEDQNGYAVKLMFEEQIPDVQGVTFLADTDYKGIGATLVPGEYDKEALEAAGLPIDGISSIQVPDGYAAYVYDGADFDGSYRYYEKDLADLGSFNDTIASVKVVKNTDMAEEVVPENGKAYKIVLRSDPDYVIEYDGDAVSNANVQIGLAEADAENQEWMFIPVEGQDGYYRISPAANPEVCMDIDGGRYENGSNILLYDYGEGANNRHWKLDPTGSGYYSIVSKGNNAYCIDESKMTPEDGANIQVWEYSFGDRQQWKLEEVKENASSEEAKKRIEEGSYVVSQTEANTQEQVKEWLLGEIQAIIQETGTSVQEEDVTMIAFEPATAGTQEEVLGTQGRFSFQVTLPGQISTEIVSGIIQAEIYADADLTLEEAIQKAQEAQAKAEAAQKEAQTAKEEALKAQTEAETAKAAAEAAKQEADAAKQAAQDAITQAGADSAAAQAAMQEAVQKAQEAADAKAAAEAAKTAAEAAKADAAKAKEEAETLLAAAKTLAEQAELKAAEAEAAWKEAEAERLAAEAAQKEAEAERLKAEEAKKAAQEERMRAEEAKKAAEEAKAEALRLKEELEKARQEAAKDSAEDKDNGEKGAAQKVGKVTLKSVKRQSRGRLKVTWKKAADATGYEIVYSRNAKFKNAVTKKVSAKKTSLALKKLKSKKTYYVKVRAVKKTESGTVYGAYSKAKKARVK